MRIDGVAEVGPLRDVRMVQPGTVVSCKTKGKLDHFMAVKSVTTTGHLVCWDVVNPGAFQNLVGKGKSSIRSLALFPSPEYSSIVATYWLQIMMGHSEDAAVHC